MSIELEQTINPYLYDVKIDGCYLECGIFHFEGRGFLLDTVDTLNATQLRLIADKLDELNGEGK